METTNDDSLAEALRRHNIDLPAGQVDVLDRYAQALWDINRSLNLTRHTSYEKFVTRDVVDSMQLADLLDEDAHVLDVGTGGGLPGVIMAVVRPDLQVELCESVGKKAKATQEILDRIQLKLPLHHARGEAILAEHRYDAVVVRAVAPLVRILKWFAPHWSNIGCLLAVKGSGWVAERGEARHRGYLKTLELRRAAVYKTPGTGAENVVLKIWPKEERHAKVSNQPS